MEELEFATNYPFTSIAKQLIEKEAVQINENIISRALDRIKTALKEGRLPRSSAIHKSERVEEIASCAAARMILGYMRNRYITNKYAVAESKKTNALLQTGGEGEIEELAREFGVKTKNEGNLLLAPVYSYIKFCPKSVDYKLMNRDVNNGYVIIKPYEKIRFIEEAVRKHMEKIPLVRNPPEEIKKAAEQLKEFLPKIEITGIPLTMEAGAHPPCIEKIMDSLKKHENLGHQARWYLAVYLLKSGMPIETMVSLYSNLPDFNEKITRYQIEHAKNKEYAVPACASILSYGLCCASCKIGSPLNWKRSWLYKSGRGSKVEG